MNLEEKIQKIKEKISKLPQEFNVEERYIINNNKELIELIHQTLLNNPHLINEEVFACLTDEVLMSLEEEHSQEVYYHYIDNKLKISIPATTYLEQYLERTNLTEEQKNYFREIVSNAFKSKESTINRFEISDEIVIEMRNYGRFDLISQIKEVYLEDSILEEIWNSYPFDEYPFPAFFAKNDYLSRKHIEKFPPKEAIIAYINLTSYINVMSDTEREEALNLLPKFIKVLKEKLANIETLDMSFLYENDFNFNDLVPKSFYSDNIDEEQQKGMLDIALKLFRLGLYELTNDLVNVEAITKKEIRKIIIELLTTKNYATLKKINFINFSHKFSDDIELANIFLENGFVENAEIIDFEFVEEKKDYIIEQLNNKNELFKDYSKKIFYNGVSTTPEEENLFIAKLNSGFVEYIYTGRLMQDSEENINELIFVLRNYPNIKLNCNNLSIACFLRMLDTIIETKRLESIIDFIVGSSYPENIEIFKEQRIHKLLTDIISKDFDLGLKLAQLKFKSIIEVPDLLNEYLNNDKYTERILDFVNHNENLESFYTLESYNKVKFYLSKLYQIQVENLDRIQQVVGPYIIRYIDNENIQKITNLPIEDQEKIFALFPKEEFTLQDLTSAYDSLKQYEFSNKYDNQVQIFTILLHAIDNKEEKLIESLIIEISKELDQTFLKRFLKKYDLPTEYNQDTMKELVQFVVNKLRISKGEKLEKYQTILHEMTDYYISKKREEYRKTYNMEEELQLFYELDEKSKERALIKYIIMDSQTIQTLLEKPNENQESQPTEDFFLDWDIWDYTPTEYYTLYEHLILKLEEKGIEKELAKETIDYYINKDKNMCKDFILVQKTIPLLIEITKEIIESIKGFQSVNQYGIYLQQVNEYINDADSKNEIKRIYKVNSENNVLEILTRLNIPALQKGVLSNPEVYDSLLKTMNKRKLHLLPSNLSTILGSEHINISTDLTNVAGFISFYGKIFSNTKSNLEANGKYSDNIILNLTTILIFAKVYSGISSVYLQILGSEDAKLIKANPGPNAATRKISNEERLKEAIELTKKVFERKEITIPPFEQDASIGDNKKLHIIVGNFTHPSNLTHGERTGSCMRIGGVGESLFYFALENPNGFHIRFEDPATREYISRVTGFRNGNTVFLNELRESRNKDKYSNEDVIEACIVAAKRLIELSKNSPCPIENVVIHRAYATQNMPAKMEYLNVGYIKKGLPQFYTDVSTSAIILATSAKNSKYVPLNFDKTHIPRYQPLREAPKVAKDFQDASDRINRVHSVKKLLASEYYEYIEPLQFPNGLIYAKASEDWYIYVDKNGEIIKDIIDIDPRAKEELAEALIEIEKNITQIKQSNQEAKYGL